jgi:23S rRNA pseudouridine1911/1915/1917 synthase
MEHLSHHYRHSSREEWQRRLERGEIFLDGSSMEKDALLRPGQQLCWHRPPWDEPDVPLDYAVLHLDEDLLVVAKPSGLPTIPGGGFLEHTLLNRVRRAFPEATPVHRLGRSTSGLVLFARSAHARAGLALAMRLREVTKIYRALASGTPTRDRFTIEAPIGPVAHPALGSVHAATPAGKPALSRVRVLERRHQSSLVEVEIETGRPHQIRIHLAAAGHPLVGDPLYASGGGIRRDEPGLPGDPGYRLHAERIRLRHPATGGPLDLHCVPPPELRIS